MSASVAPGEVHSLVLIGGLGDGLLTIPYSPALAARLPAPWRLLLPVLRSSYGGWGVSSLSSDVTQLTLLVHYLRRARPRGKVVFLGHSTGCQDTMHYLTSEGAAQRPKIDGAILQAPVSDREGMAMLMGDMQEEHDEAVEMAREWVAEGKGDDVLPNERTIYFYGKHAAVSANRFLSLMSPGPEHDGEDDYFSSDLGPERLRKTFGKVGASGVPIMLLNGSADEYLPPHVDPEALLEKWRAVLKEGNAVVDEGSAVVAGADHQLAQCNDAVRDDVFKRMLAFISRM